MHVAIASPEIAPFAKTGGLSDVLGSLPGALERFGLRVSLIMPAYRAVLRGGFLLEDTGVRFTVPVSNRREEGVILKAKTGSTIPFTLSVPTDTSTVITCTVPRMGITPTTPSDSSFSPGPYLRP